MSATARLPFAHHFDVELPKADGYCTVRVRVGIAGRPLLKISGELDAFSMGADVVFALELAWECYRQATQDNSPLAGDACCDVPKLPRFLAKLRAVE